MIADKNQRQHEQRQCANPILRPQHFSHRQCCHPVTVQRQIPHVRNIYDEQHAEHDKQCDHCVLSRANTLSSTRSACSRRRSPRSWRFSRWRAICHFERIIGAGRTAQLRHGTARCEFSALHDADAITHPIGSSTTITFGRCTNALAMMSFCRTRGCSFRPVRYATAPDRTARAVRGRASRPPAPARRRLQDPRDHAHRRGLASAIRSQQPEQLAAGNREVE